MTRTVIFVTISLVYTDISPAWAFQRRLIYFPMGGTVCGSIGPRCRRRGHPANR